MGGLGNYYHRQYEEGHREAIGALRAAEANLLHAWRLARRQGLWDRVIGPMQGLGQLYEHTGRRAEWAALVAAVVPELLAPDDGPLPGREEHWGLVTEYRVGLARDERNWAEAERLQQRRVEWDRGRAARLLGRPAEELDDSERNRVRTLAASLHGLGQILREQEDPECVPAYEEARELAERIGDTAAAAACAFNLGHVFKDLFALRDLARADHWYRRSLELRPEGDRLLEAKCHNQLGSVAWERAREAQAAGATQEVGTQVRAALDHYHQALDLLPADAVNDLFVTHGQLGSIYKNIGGIDAAMPHYQEAIRLSGNSGDHYRAAETRHNVALALLQAGRRADALDYARAALRGYQRYGERAQRDIEQAQAMIDHLQA